MSKKCIIGEIGKDVLSLSKTLTKIITIILISCIGLSGIILFITYIAKNYGLDTISYFFLFSLIGLLIIGFIKFIIENKEDILLLLFILIGSTLGFGLIYLLGILIEKTFLIGLFEKILIGDISNYHGIGLGFIGTIVIIWLGYFSLLLIKNTREYYFSLQKRCK